MVSKEAIKTCKAQVSNHGEFRNSATQYLLGSKVGLHSSASSALLYEHSSLRSHRPDALSGARWSLPWRGDEDVGVIRGVADKGQTPGLGDGFQ